MPVRLLNSIAGTLNIKRLKWKHNLNVFEKMKGSHIIQKKTNYIITNSNSRFPN